MARPWVLALGCSVALVSIVGSTGPARAEDYIVNKRNALPFPPNVLEPKSICGPADESEDVERYDGKLGVTRAYVDANEASTAQIQWADEAVITAKLPDYSPGNVAAERWCTGTLLADDYFLTAGHCLDVQNGSDYWVTPFTRKADRSVSFADPKILATLQVVNFKYQLDPSGMLRTADVYPVAQLVEYRQGPDRLDYAVLKLGANAAGKLPSQTYPVAKLAKRAVKDGELLAILQHPQGQPKKIDAGELYEERESYLYYSNIDTLGGSSGSGIRDGTGEIVGVHTNGGCTPNGGANSGVSLDAILKVSNVLK